jgi:hypothetical protein
MILFCFVNIAFYSAIKLNQLKNIETRNLTAFFLDSDNKMTLDDVSNQVDATSNIESDDDVSSLSTDALKALQEFYSQCGAIKNEKIKENWVLTP